MARVRVLGRDAPRLNRHIRHAAEAVVRSDTEIIALGFATQGLQGETEEVRAAIRTLRSRLAERREADLQYLFDLLLSAGRVDEVRAAVLRRLDPEAKRDLVSGLTGEAYTADDEAAFRGALERAMVGCRRWVAEEAGGDEQA